MLLEQVIFEMKKDMLVQFPNAKFLTLRASTADEILGFLEMFPELTTLTLKHKDICLVEPPMSLVRQHKSILLIYLFT